MSFTLGRYVNKTVRVSIPVLFPEGPHCVVELLAVEPIGVWLEGEALLHAVYPRNPPESTRVFIPFAQIAYIVEDTSPPEPVAGEKEEATPPKPKRPGHRGAVRHKHHR